MSDIQAQRAIQNMYADPSVREELIDEEADVLFKWGEEQIKNLAAQNLDDARFEAANTHLNRMLGEINRYIGKRSYMPPAEQTDSLGEIVRLATALNYKIAPAAVEAYAQEAAPQSNIEALNALTSLLKPPVSSAAASAAAEEKPVPKPSLGDLLKGGASAFAPKPQATQSDSSSSDTEPSSPTEGEAR